MVVKLNEEESQDVVKQTKPGPEPENDVGFNFDFGSANFSV